MAVLVRVPACRGWRDLTAHPVLPLPGLSPQRLFHSIEFFITFNLVSFDLFVNDLKVRFSLLDNQVCFYLPLFVSRLTPSWPSQSTFNLSHCFLQLSFQLLVSLCWSSLNSLLVVGGSVVNIGNTVYINTWIDGCVAKALYYTQPHAVFRMH